MKSTSAETYRAIIKEGTYGKTLLMVLKCISESEPINQTMAYEVLKKNSPGLQKYTISPRFSVLERMGLIQQAHVDKCPFSQRNTVFWKLTGRTHPVMSASEAAKAVTKAKDARLKGSETIEVLQEKIKKLERRVLRIEQISSSFSTGQMTMI